MNHVETMMLAQERREALLRDARIVRSVPRARSGRRPGVRSWLARMR